MAQPVELTLANLAGGALMECATAEIRKVCQNIQDPNVKADAKRKITIAILIEPDERRQMAKVTYSVKSDCPGPDAGKSMAYIALDPETDAVTLIEVEQHPPLFAPQEPLPNITTLPATRQA